MQEGKEVGVDPPDAAGMMIESDSYRRYRKDRSRDDLRRRSQTDRRRSRRYSSESSEEEKRDKKKVVAPVEPKG